MPIGIIFRPQSNTYNIFFSQFSFFLRRIEIQSKKNMLIPSLFLKVKIVFLYIVESQLYVSQF